MRLSSVVGDCEIYDIGANSNLHDLDRIREELTSFQARMFKRNYVQGLGTHRAWR